MADSLRASRSLREFVEQVNPIVFATLLKSLSERDMYLLVRGRKRQGFN